MLLASAEGRAKGPSCRNTLLSQPSTFSIHCNSRGRAQGWRTALHSRIFHPAELYCFPICACRTVLFEGIGAKCSAQHPHPDLQWFLKSIKNKQAIPKHSQTYQPNAGTETRPRIPTQPFHNNILQPDQRASEADFIYWRFHFLLCHNSNAPNHYIQIFRTNGFIFFLRWQMPDDV